MSNHGAFWCCHITTSTSVELGGRTRSSVQFEHPHDLLRNHTVQRERRQGARREEGHSVRLEAIPCGAVAAYDFGLKKQLVDVVRLRRMRVHALIVDRQQARDLDLKA